MRAAVHRELRPGTGKGASAGAGPPRRAAPHGRLWAAPGPRVVVARLLIILVVASVMMLVRFDTEQRVADFSPVVNLASMRSTVRRVHWLVVHKVLKMRVNNLTHAPRTLHAASCVPSHAQEICARSSDSSGHHSASILLANRASRGMRCMNDAFLCF